MLCRSVVQLHFFPAFYPYGAANNQVPIKIDIQRASVPVVPVVLLHFKSVRLVHPIIRVKKVCHVFTDSNRETEQ